MVGIMLFTSIAIQVHPETKRGRFTRVRMLATRLVRTENTVCESYDPRLNLSFSHICCTIGIGCASLKTGLSTTLSFKCARGRLDLFPNHNSLQNKTRWSSIWRTSRSNFLSLLASEGCPVFPCAMSWCELITVYLCRVRQL